MRRRRGTLQAIAPHVCPANPSGAYVTVSIDGMRAAGLTEEADRLARQVRVSAIWGGRITENAIALSTFGCCRHAELAAKSCAARDGSPIKEDLHNR